MGVGFEGFGLEPPLLQAVRGGFDEIFPIQAEAIAPLLEGRDLMGQAHTGAGKTLAFALPMLQKIDRRTHDAWNPRAGNSSHKRASHTSGP